MQSSSLKTSWSIKIYNKAREFIAAIELNFYFRSDSFIMKIIIFMNNVAPVVFTHVSSIWPEPKYCQMMKYFSESSRDFFAYIVGKLLLQWKQNICLFTQIVTLPYREWEVRLASSDRYVTSTITPVGSCRIYINYAVFPINPTRCIPSKSSRMQWCDFFVWKLCSHRPWHISADTSRFSHMLHLPQFFQNLYL